MDLCKRCDGTGPLDVVTTFNRLQQWADVLSYQKRFEELHCRVQVVRPHLDELYFVQCFVGGLKEEIGPMVKVGNPKTLVAAYNMVKLYEQSQNAAKQQSYKPNRPIPLPYSHPKAPTAPLLPKTSIVPPSNAKPPLPKNPTIEALRERNLCFCCHERYTPGHQCKNRALNALEGEENFVEASDGELKNEAEAIIQEAQGEVSLNVVMGLSHSPNTIRVAGWAKKQ